MNNHSNTGRYLSLDLIRGFAILGILVDNIQHFGQTLLFPYHLQSPANVSAWLHINSILPSGTTRYLFFMLFAIGVCISTEAGLTTSSYIKRSIGLFTLGLFNYFILLWELDILTTFAAASLLLLPLIRLKPYQLIIAAFTLSVFFYSIFHNAILKPAENAHDAYLASLESSYTIQNKLVQAGADAHDSATSSEAIALLSSHFSNGYFYALQYITDNAHSVLVRVLLHNMWEALILFLIGVFIYKSGYLRLSIPVLALVALVTLPTGLYLSYSAHTTYMTNFVTISQYRILYYNYVYTNLTLAVGYGSLLMILARQLPNSKALIAVSIIGKYSLSNYLLQSTLALLLFVLLRQYALFSTIQLFTTMVVIWLIQITLTLYLSKNNISGPAEYLLRSFYK